MFYESNHPDWARASKPLKEPFGEPLQDHLLRLVLHRHLRMKIQFDVLGFCNPTRATRNTA